MSVNKLRQAARVLQERAEEATPGPWEVAGPYESGTVYLHNHEEATEVARFDAPWETGNIDFISLWSPGVAQALADWLDAVGKATHGTSRGDVPFEDDALAVADLILGGDDS